MCEAKYVEIPRNEARLGDFVVFMPYAVSPVDTVAGERYAITRIDEEGDFEFIDDVGDEELAVNGVDLFKLYRYVTTEAPVDLTELLERVKELEAKVARLAGNQ